MNPHSIIVYVDDIKASMAFYKDLLGCEPVEYSSGFAMFPLGGSMMLGLWATPTVQPKVSQSGGSEIAVSLPSQMSVDSACAAWKAAGREILQEPTRMDFGYTFVGLDPDGHRIRQFAPVA